MIDIDRTLRLLDVGAESNFVQAEAIDAINYLREENKRLRDLLDNALGWLDDKEQDKPLLSVDNIRAARAAIRERDAKSE